MSSLAIEMLEKKIRRRRRDAKNIVIGKHKQLHFIMMLRDSEAPPSRCKFVKTIKWRCGKEYQSQSRFYLRLVINLSQNRVMICLS
jgi:hypothetical protein